MRQSAGFAFVAFCFCLNYVLVLRIAITTTPLILGVLTILTHIRSNKITVTAAYILLLSKK